MNENGVYVALAVMAAFLVYRRLFGPKKTPAAELAELIHSGARVVDVRTPGEFSSGSYPKARNIPLSDLAARQSELGPKDKPVVLFCASGSRSAQAAGFLRKAGWTKVANAGGLAEMPR